MTERSVGTIHHIAQRAVAENTLLPTPLAVAITEKIKQNGPISFDEYMQYTAYSMQDRNGDTIPGYYGKSVVIGDRDNQRERKDVDFWTPPEYSPIFGLSIADQIYQMWVNMGHPKDFSVVEMGAGNGTLAHDILHGFSYLHNNSSQSISHESHPDIVDLSKIVNYTIVENSPKLLQEQKERLREVSANINFVQASADELPLRNVTGVFLSTELPDAFPVRVIRENGDGKVEELFVGEGDEKAFSQVWTEPSASTRAFLDKFHPELSDEVPYPVNIHSVEWMHSVGGALQKGYAITVDYDWRRSIGVWIVPTRVPNVSAYDLDSLFLKSLAGDADITSGVDFQVLADAGKQAHLLPQGYSTLPGFLFSLCYDMKLASLSGRKLGDRAVGENRSWELFRTAAWNVLIQSKNVPESNLAGLQFTFNEHEDFASDEYERARFHPINL